MKSVFAALALAGGLMHAGSALAQVNLKVEHPWVRGTVAGQGATGAFLQLTASKDARLVDAQSPLAASVEIHQMEMQGDVMKMRQVDGVDLPAGKAVDFKPGSYHLMLMQLKHALKPGAVVPVMLVVEGRDKSRTTMTINMPVKALGD